MALEYFLAAPDAAAITAAAEVLAERDPAAAYDLVRLLQIRLAMLGTHPDAVAEARWEMGGLANRKAWRQVPGSVAQRDWLKRGLRDYEAAVALAPLSERYVIADANQADLLGERERARTLFAQAVAIDPASAEAIAGLGVVAYENGDRDAAVAYLLRARAIDPHGVNGSRPGTRPEVRVALDAQLTVGTATGIGEYVRGLAGALRARSSTSSHFAKSV